MRKVTVIIKKENDMPIITIKGRGIYNVYSGAYTLDEALRGLEKDHKIKVKKMKIFYKNS